jgi:ferritin-like metal-binding protein YciE
MSQGSRAAAAVARRVNTPPGDAFRRAALASCDPGAVASGVPGTSGPRDRLNGIRKPQDRSAAMKTKSLEGLFHETLRDIYYAERKILKALPKMARGTKSAKLRAAFEKHHEETETHIERLQEVFDLIGKPARGKTCLAIEGIIEEGEEVLSEFKDSDAVDAGLVAAAQAVEHYEIARYGTLRNWAELLGQTEAAKLLQQTLSEEEATDATLSDIATSSVNEAALKAA